MTPAAGSLSVGEAEFLRKAMGLTQGQFAKGIGLSRQQWNYIAMGHGELRPIYALAIERFVLHQWAIGKIFTPPASIENDINLIFKRHGL